MSNIVAIVGRPNVGKSTLFNRLLERREAIVDSTAGVTRDRHYGKSDWNGVEFTVIDTGGYEVNTEDIFQEEISKQVQLAIDEATSIIFMLNVEEGLTDTDFEIFEKLRRSNKPTYIVVNKVDSAKEELAATEFYQLGIEKYFTLSSATGSGTGELLDDIVNDFPTTEYKDPFDGLPKITIVGRPNVGKSTLTNALLDNERNIVTDIAGTTRDSVQSLYNKFGHEFVLVDTAGMRRKAKVSEDLEFYSVMRSVRAIEHSDVVIIMVDATLGWESQDMSIFGIAQRNRKGIVILVNKWDLVEDKKTNTMRDFEAAIKHKIGQFSDVPILFVSALTKQRILKAVDTAMEVYEDRKKKIKTSKLNEVMLPIFESTPPPAIKGKYIKIKYCVQLPTPSPQFVFFCNLPQYVKEPYKRFTVLSNNFSLVNEWINELRNVDVQTDRMRFRRNMERIGEIAAFEISKHLEYKDVEITTPLDKIMSKEIAVQPVITTILRAGVPLFEGILNYLDKADCGFVAAYRKHDANDYFSIKQDYLTCPNIEGRPLIVADPMLATGASLIEALKDLLTNGNPSQVHIVSAIASKQGVETIQKAFPEAYLWIGVVDESLTSKGYITPGLGDAGDLSYGEKLQR